MNRRLAAIAVLMVPALAGLVPATGQARTDLSYIAGPVQVSRPTPFEAGCGRQDEGVVVQPDAVVQPQLAAHPNRPGHLVGTYQQDRWSDIGSRGAFVVTSFNGGLTWNRTAMPVSACAGGQPAHGGDFSRVLDAWASVAPDGTAHFASLSLTGTMFDPASEHVIHVARSGDGGRTWGTPLTIVREQGTVLNDYPTITADPTDSRYVYLLWCRIDVLDDGQQRGPMYLARSTDGGRTWEQPRTIYDAGVNHYTFANSVDVLPDGTLVAAFASIREDPVTFQRDVDAVAIRSTDKGATWSAPVKIADVEYVGAVDPDSGTPVLDAGFLVHSGVDGRGVLSAVWQDGRFTGGAHDAIALSRSTDGGRTWSPPVAVNGDLSVPAFGPEIAVRRDGTVAVTYHDLRPNTADPATLPVRIWLASSDGRPGSRWTQRAVTGPFDLAKGPKADIFGMRFLYLGAQYGMTAAGPLFVSMFGSTRAGDPDDRSVIQAAPMLVWP